MTKEAVELISQYGGEIREKYSGRGMFGKETVGIIFEDDKEFHHALADAFSDCIQDSDEENGDILCKALKSLQTDKRGRSIIYY